MLSKILESVRSKKILVVGDLMLDSYVYGTCTRISPEAPVPIIHIDRKHNCLGGAANVAVNLRSMGCETWVAGYLGSDDKGDQCFSQMQENNINTQAIVFSKNPTISKTRIVGNNQHIVRIDNEEEFNNINEHDFLIQKLNTLPHKFDAIIVSDYAKGTIKSNIIGHLRSIYPANIFVDPKPSNAMLYKNIRCLSPNLAEAKMMAHISSNNPNDLGKVLLAQSSADIVLITLADKGLSLYTDSMTIHFPAHTILQKDIVQSYRFDVAGAGDTLLAVFCAFSITTNLLSLSAYLANIAAAIVVNKLGTQTFTMNELIEEINNDQEMVAKLCRANR